MKAPVRRTLLAVLVTAAVHLVLARVSFGVAGVENASPIWIPAGVDVALLVLLGRQAWPGVLAGDLLANAGSSLPLGALAGCAAANAIAAVFGSGVIVRWTSAPGPLRHRRDVLVAVLVAAPLAGVVCATIGVGALQLTGALAPPGFATAWRNWVLSDIAGVVVLTPAVMILATSRLRLPTAGRAAEAAVLLATLAASCEVAFAGGVEATYVVFPVIVWAALRFRLPGAAVTSVTAAVVAVAGAASAAVGSSGGLGDVHALLHAQAFMAVTTLTALLLAIVSDEREAAQRELAHRAGHDPLTGLANRALLAEHLDDALARGGAQVGLALIDLDQFKTVNDSLGHQAGDDLLMLVAPRLRAAARPQDLVARLGGDEFVVLSEGLAGPWEALEVARRLAAAWVEPFRLGDDDVFVSGATGVAVGQGGRASAATLLREADAAMYRAKERGRGHVELYDEIMRARAFERLRLEGDLRRALTAGGIGVAFQPILDLHDGRPVAVEALARWEHPERGWLSPSTFIPMAEESGLIAELGRHVLWTACRELARWRAEIPGAEELQVSVNVSARQLARGELPGEVREALRATGLPPQALALELTESALMEEREGPGPALAALRALGVEIVLDDFGTGYSSLSYLRRFPLDGLKLDRSFVDGLVAQRHAAAVVAAIVDMGAQLGLTVTAEGIETREQAEHLRGIGCPRGQGYVLARPLPAAEIPAVLAGPLRRRGRVGAPQARTVRNEY